MIKRSDDFLQALVIILASTIGGIAGALVSTYVNGIAGLIVFIVIMVPGWYLSLRVAEPADAPL